MGKTEFAQTLMRKMNEAIGIDGSSFNAGSATAAMQALADGITEYLTNNTEVVVSYSGIIPGVPPIPDPITVDKFKIEGKCLAPGPAPSFDIWIKILEANIISGFYLEPLGALGLTFVNKPFVLPGIAINQALLTSLHNPNDENPQIKMWEAICEDIMRWLTTSAINLTPGTATRPLASSSGIANISLININ